MMKRIISLFLLNLNMRKQLLALTLFFMTFVIHGFSQKTFAVHPSLGDTISNAEKKKYYLFEQLADETYIFSVFSSSGNDSIVTHFMQNDTIRARTNSKEIAGIIHNVGRLDAMYDSTVVSGQVSYLRNPNLPLVQQELTVGSGALKPTQQEKNAIKADAKVHNKTRPVEWDKNTNYDYINQQGSYNTVPAPKVSVPYPH
jgi:hypothetical protein